MINWEFHQLLKQCHWKERRLTVEVLADELFTSRPHLGDVLNNKPKHGAKTRPKVVRWFTRHFPEQTPRLLELLGWDEKGRIKPRS